MGLDMYLFKKINAEEAVEKDIQRRLAKAFAYGDWKKEKEDIEASLGYSLPITEYTWIDKEKYVEDLDKNPDDDKLLIEWSPVGVSEKVGYWRKFNALHNWFVENVQGGVDDCDAYEVTQEHLEMLGLTLEMVVDEKNMGEDAQKKLLPTRSGFFFGGTDYDTYYYSEVRKTRELIEEWKQIDMEKYKLYYQSSW